MIDLALRKPILAYANNYDFVRLSSCFGLWQAEVPDAALDANHPEAPLRRYRFTDVRLPDICFPSSDFIFLSVFKAGKYALNALKEVQDDSFDMRKYGIFRATLSALLIVGLFVHIARKSVFLGVSLAVLCALYLSDPIVSLYFSGFYAELTVSLSCVATAFLTFVLMGPKRSPTDFVLWAIAALILATSKTQYFMLPAVFGVGLAMRTCRWKEAIAGAAVVCLVLVSAGAFHAVIAKRAGFSQILQMANATDTVFGAVLPASSDPKRALSILRLPEKCGELTGKNWYSPELRSGHPCPEIMKFSRRSLLHLFVVQPETFFQPISVGLGKTRPWLHAYLGQIEGKPYGAVTDAGGLASLTIDSLVRSIDQSVFRILTIGAMSAWLILGPIAWVRRRDDGLFIWVVRIFMISSAACFYAVVSSVFGDGYLDFIKHTHLLQVFMACMFSTLVGLGLVALLRRIGARTSAQWI